MMEIPILFIKTILLRPYVFVFLIAFLVAGTISMGRIRTLVFLLVTWMIAFASEYCSTRTGFPYGFYHYTELTRGQELFISNVPFMDSLSYTFLLFASYSTALFSLAPLRIQGWNIQMADTFTLRKSCKVLFLTAVYMMMIDVVIDPIALRGERWFLGKIYYYDHQGYYFGVPLSNAMGWGLVGLVATFLFQKLETKFLGTTYCDKGIRLWPARGLLGVGLYFGVLMFNLGITAWIKEWGLLMAGCFVYLIPIVLLGLRLFDPKVRATDEEWQKHIRDFRISG